MMRHPDVFAERDIYSRYLFRLLSNGVISSCTNRTPFLIRNLLFASLPEPRSLLPFPPPASRSLATPRRRDRIGERGRAVPVSALSSGRSIEAGDATLIYARPRHPIATPLLVKLASIPRRSAIDRLASETPDRVNETRLRRARFRRPNREAALRINLKSTGAPRRTNLLRFR